jgi:hypothetical protein
MKTGTGYLTSATNPNFSGLTRLAFRDTLEIGPDTTFEICHTESGHGMRMLVAALGVGGKLTNESARVAVEYVIDDLGLLESIQT